MVSLPSLTARSSRQLIPRTITTRRTNSSPQCRRRCRGRSKRASCESASTTSEQSTSATTSASQSQSPPAAAPTVQKTSESPAVDASDFVNWRQLTSKLTKLTAIVGQIASLLSTAGAQQIAVSFPESVFADGDPNAIGAGAAI